MEGGKLDRDYFTAEWERRFGKPAGRLLLPRREKGKGPVHAENMWDGIGSAFCCLLFRYVQLSLDFVGGSMRFHDFYSGSCWISEANETLQRIRLDST